MESGYRAVACAAALAAAMWRAAAAPQSAAPYARIAFLRPHDGDTVDFEAGYIRHLAWHQQAKDSWTWYGWTITFGDRQRWFVYASFAHTAASFDSPVTPADDERDNILNVTPHAEFAGNGLYEYLPALSRGSGVPTAAARLELTTVELASATSAAFERAIAAAQSTLTGETLWYRLVAGGASPRYVRLRPRPTFTALLDAADEQRLPDALSGSIGRTTIEILTLRPTMSYGVDRSHP
jgi:hypothetical protein